MNGLDHVKEVDKRTREKNFYFERGMTPFVLALSHNKSLSILFINFKDQTRRYMIQWTKKTDILTFSQQLLNLLHADWKIRQGTNMLALCN